MLPRRIFIADVLDNESEALAFADENVWISIVTSCPHDGYGVRCLIAIKYKYRRCVCIMKETVLRHLKLPLNDLIHISYLWLSKESFNTLTNITGHSRSTITIIIRLLRKEIADIIEEGKNSNRRSVCRNQNWQEKV